MHRTPVAALAAVAALIMCLATLVSGCAGGGPAPRILWGPITYTSDDGYGSARVTGNITNLGTAVLSYAAIVAYAYDVFGNQIAMSPTISIRGIQPRNFLIYPAQTQEYDLVFSSDDLIGLDRFRITIVSSLDPLRETGWQALFVLNP